MIFWLMVAYVIAAMLSVKPLAEAALDAILEQAERERARDKALYPTIWQNYHLVGEIVPSASGRRRAVWVGIGKSLVWPVTVPVLILSRSLTSPTERQRKAEAENKKLRELARKEGLDWPEDGRR